jgi:phytoene dehydrogenase-like protein
MQPDYLIIGSDLSALTFGALMTNEGKTVQIVEAHEHPCGFRHKTAIDKKYNFNTQFHYVWDCDEWQTVNDLLKKLESNKDVTFERYDPNGFNLEAIINSLVEVIRSHGGEVFLNHEITNFRLIDKTLTVVEAIDLTTHQNAEFTGNSVICNIEPQQTTKTIDLEKFSSSRALLY